MKKHHPYYWIFHGFELFLLSMLSFFIIIGGKIPQEAFQSIFLMVIYFHIKGESFKEKK